MGSNVRTTVVICWGFVSCVIWQGAVAAIKCDGPQISDQQVQAIVKRERFVRNDLPKESDRSHTTTVKRQGCYYYYYETLTNASPDDANINLVLDQYGVIVDAVEGRTGPRGALECPKRKLSDDEVASAVKEQRNKDPELPKPPLGDLSVSVSPIRCMYAYVESAESQGKKRSVIITLDQYGQVLSVSEVGDF